MKTAPICGRCGLCCKRLIIEADAEDVLREPRIAVVNPLRKRPPDLHILDACWRLADCPFLGAGNACAIYRTRPAICVIFPPGGEKCSELREEAGLPPLAQGKVPDVVAEIQEAYRESER